MSEPRNRRLDAGIVIRDSQAALRFYRDVLGLEHVGDIPLTAGVMHMLKWGESLVKLMRHDAPAAVANPPGGMFGGTGIRYVTLSVDDLPDSVQRCAAAGYRVAVPITNFRPGMTVAIIEDPEGNWIELLQA